MALSLGRITVQSALGEPLRAEIEIPEINAEEAASLKAGVALPDAFRAAGLEYNPAMSSLQVSLQRRNDGRAFIRLSGDRAINDPFVDMILEASWASGRIVRDYTMLFDPPNLRQGAVAVPTAPQVGGGSTATPGVQVITVPPAPAVAGGSGGSGRQAAVMPRAVVAAGTKPANAGAKQITVQPGDTASKIASANKPASISLDQMLVALMRANPEAFVRGNLNRIKAGALVDIPSESEAQSTGAAEATQQVIAQSRDFNEFRKKLATSAPAAQVAAPDRASSGNVQAKVTEKKPAATAPDKLTLSKGAIDAKAAEDKVAKERQAVEAANRAREMSKNITELSKLGAASGAAGTAPVASAASAKAASAVSAPAVTMAKPVASAPAAPVVAASQAAPPVAAPSVTATSAPAPAAAIATPASAPPAASAAKPPASARAAVPTPAEPSLLDTILENPMVPAAAGGLLALLAGFGYYRIRQRRNAGQVDSAFLESRLQPDSFFGASGGQRIDTNDGAATGSSMVYTPSQLDAADDVDPVAEADVYLAYGRDLQAEEILKEALRTNSGRVAIHQKLLEIYAKRRDGKGFETVASQAYKVTSGEGAEWDRICDLGLSIDPTNPLYQPGGQPAFGAGISRPAALDDTVSFAASTQTTTQPTTPVVGSHPIDLDLDLDFSLDDLPPASPVAVAMADPDATVSMRAAAPAAAPALDLDFGLDIPDAPDTITSPAQTDAHEQTQNMMLPELDLTGTPPLEHDTTPAAVELTLDEMATGPSPLSATPANVTVPAPLDTGMMEFDLGSLSLDLGPVSGPVADTDAAAAEDPLATKLALADEFIAIGDDDGARALIEEVIAEASGDMKATAQRALSNLN